MTTLTLEIQLPESVELSEHDAKRLFVEKLYEEGILTPGRGAEMLGMTYREFVDAFGFYIRTTPEELKEDIKTLDRLFESRAKATSSNQADYSR